MRAVPMRIMFDSSMRTLTLLNFIRQATFCPVAVFQDAFQRLTLPPEETRHSPRTQPRLEQASDGDAASGVALTDDQKARLVALLKDYYVPGQRHNLALAMAGYLAKKGVPKADAIAIFEALIEVEMEG